MAITYEAPPVNLRWAAMPDGSKTLQLGVWWTNSETGEKGLAWEPLREVPADLAKTD